MTQRLRLKLMLRLAGLLVLAPWSALAPAAPAQDVSGAFVPPQSEMLLTRLLLRVLPDGKEVVATRRYAVRFAREADGFRVDGRLVDVSVEVPPSLQALAEIERNRPDTGMFPIQLDAAGMIVGGQPAAAGEAIERAADHATRQIGASGLAAIDMLQAQAFVRQMRNRPAASQWPADLFRPGASPRSETRDVPLPGGQTGRVIIEIAARSAGSSGILASLERTVTTDLAGDKRVTREQWTLGRTAINSAR